MAIMFAPPTLLSRDWFAYYADLFIVPLLALVAVLFFARSASFAAWAAGGFLLGTLNEYAVHRWVLHGPFWMNMHERHHHRPAEWITFEPLVLVPGVFTVLLAGAATASVWLESFSQMLAGIFVGFALWYIWFLTMHHWLHHVDLAQPHWRWLQRYAVWHNRHHKVPAINFGITVPWWDQVFGTSR